MISSSSSIAPEEGDAMHGNVSRLPGFRFCPSDETLVSYYLKNKIEGTDSHLRHVIPEFDASKFNPPDLRGYYKITGDEREIRAAESNAVIGKKIILTFYEGRGPKAKKSDWVLHEYYYCTQTEVGSKPTKLMDFVLCRLKNKSASYKKPKVDPTLGELADSGANQEDDQAAAASNVISEPVEHLGCKELGHVNSSESPDGSYTINWNDILNFVSGDDETVGRKVSDLEAKGTCNDCSTIQSPFGDVSYSYTDKNDISTCDEGEPHSFTVFDLENKAANDMSQKLCVVQPQKDMDLLQHVTQQSPTYTKLEDFMDFFDECVEWQPQIGDEYSHVNCKNNISTNDKNEPVSYNAFDLENQYADYMILEPCVQPEKYLGSVLHADICDNGYNNWQPTCWDKDSYLTNKKNISTNDKDKQYSSIASNFDNQATNKRKR